MVFFQILFILIFLVSCRNNSCKNRDLKFIYEQIQESHPGIFNKEDPTFKKNLEYNYAKAQRAICKTSQSDEHKQIIKAFVSTFNDTHLSIHWYDTPKALFPNLKPFQIKYLPKHVVWINLPSCDLTKS